MPPALLEGISIDELELDEFFELLAKARYIQEVEASIIQRGIVNAYCDE